MKIFFNSLFTNSFGCGITISVIRIIIILIKRLRENMEIKRKNSVKRTAILDALSASKEHPTAEALYASLRREYPDLSLGTVYRNLGMFCEEGKALSVCHVEGKEHFDARMDAHAHLVCRKCGRVLDVELPDEFSRLSFSLCEKCACQAESFQLVFSGLCDVCSKDPA